MGRHDVRVEQVPDPTILNARDAIIKVTSTAICGSDLHLYDGYIPTMQRGDVLGHEFMGEVVEVGKENTRLKIGDRVDARIRAAAAGHLVERVVDVVVLVVDDVRRACARVRHPQPVREPIDRDDLLGAHQACARNREQADRSTAPHRDDLTGLDVAHLRAHVGRREDVGQEQHLLVRQRRRHLDRPDIRERHAHVLRLSARIAAIHV